MIGNITLENSYHLCMTDFLRMLNSLDFTKWGSIITLIRGDVR